MSAPKRFGCAVLTGATGGLGQALARQLASVCDELVLTGRKADVLYALCDQLKATRVSAVVGDLTTEVTRMALAHQTQARGGCDLVIHNAGVNSFQRFEKQSESTVANLLQTNLVAPILLTQHLWTVRRPQAQTQMVFIGSAFGQLGFPGFAAYSASKFGLRGFVEALQREWADPLLRVRYFSPRAIDTDINTPEVRRMCQALGASLDTPERVAELFMRFLQGEETMQQIGNGNSPEPLADAMDRCERDRFFTQSWPVIRTHCPV